VGGDDDATGQRISGMLHIGQLERTGDGRNRAIGIGYQADGGWARADAAEPSMMPRVGARSSWPGIVTRTKSVPPCSPSARVT